MKDKLIMMIIIVVVMSTWIIILSIYFNEILVDVESKGYMYKTLSLLGWVIILTVPVVSLGIVAEETIDKEHV